MSWGLQYMQIIIVLKYVHRYFELMQFQKYNLETTIFLRLMILKENGWDWKPPAPALLFMSFKP